ncbi:hypothetical protein ACQJBY_043676 [Aegilops geniculata]
MANKKDMRFRDGMPMVRKRSPPGPTTLHEVPDKLLELILLHLSSPLWLIHAAATCKRWRRIIVDRRFLCDISNRDPSSVVAGDYHNHASPVDGRRHVFVPSSPALAVGSRYFSLDFLPAGGGTSWEIIDSCHSLLLLAKKKTGWRRHCLPDLLVCEPVTQRYRLIPRMEHMKYERCLTVFLHGCHSRGATTRRGHTIDVMLKFKVICVLHRKYTRISDDIGVMRAFVFERSYRGRPGWYVRHWPMDEPRIRQDGTTEPLYFLGRATSSLFWALQDDVSSLLAYSFHRRSGFEVLPLPDHIQGLPSRAFRNSDGEACLVCLQGSSLHVFAYNDGDWDLEESLELMEATRGLEEHKDEYFRVPMRIVTASTMSIVLSPADQTWQFSVDLETMEVSRYKSKTHGYPSVAYPCELPWLPAIHACMVRCRRGGSFACRHICRC